MAKRSSRHPIFQTLLLLRDADPFKAFEIFLSSGQKIEVVNATDIALNPKSDIGMFFDSTAGPHFVNLRTIASVKPARTKSKSVSNN